LESSRRVEDDEVGIQGIEIVEKIDNYNTPSLKMILSGWVCYNTTGIATTIDPNIHMG
jgi:hypothetical protein